MKTDDLIRALAADSATPPPSLRRLFIAALLSGVAIAVCLFLVFLGPRPHLPALLNDPRVLFKLCLPILLTVLSVPVVLRLVRPGSPLRLVLVLLAIVPLLLAIANVAEFITVPSVLWSERVMGYHPVGCFLSILMLSAAPLAAVLLALRHGAPEHPVFAGAAAGLLAGAAGAAVFAPHCPNDSPFFVAVWYSLAIGVVAAFGALAGARLLRW